MATRAAASKKVTILEEALRLAAIGWSVLPLYHPIATGAKPVCFCEKCGACPHIGKHPRYCPGTLEHGAHSATTNEQVIRRWWRAFPDANLGVATGERSNLLVIDVDPRHGGDDTLSDLESTFGRLPETVVVHSGGGGRHLYFQFPSFKHRGKLGAGLDVLGNGQLVVGPGSLHATGRRYQFELSSEPGLIEVAELPQNWKKTISFEGVSEDRGDREDREHSDYREQIPPHPTPVVPADPIRVGAVWTIEQLIGQTVPTGRGQHDVKTMDFARGVRLNLGITDPDQAMPLFDQWFDLAKKHLADPDWDSAWFKFLRAFEAADVPLGETNLADAAFSAALSKPLPKAADKLRSDRVRLLVGVCYELSQMRRGRSFKLSCHQVARLFGVKPQQAWDWLQGLQHYRIIKCIDPGRPGYPGRNAARFVYTAAV